MTKHDNLDDHDNHNDMKLSEFKGSCAYKYYILIRQACSSSILYSVFVKRNQNNFKYWDGNAV